MAEGPLFEITEDEQRVYDQLTHFAEEYGLQDMEKGALKALKGIMGALKIGDPSKTAWKTIVTAIASRTSTAVKVISSDGKTWAQVVIGNGAARIDVVSGGHRVAEIVMSNAEAIIKYTTGDQITHVARVMAGGPKEAHITSVGFEAFVKPTDSGGEAMVKIALDGAEPTGSATASTVEGTATAFTEGKKVVAKATVQKVNLTNRFFNAVKKVGPMLALDAVVSGGVCYYKVTKAREAKEKGEITDEEYNEIKGKEIGGAVTEFAFSSTATIGCAMVATGATGGAALLPIACVVGVGFVGRKVGEQIGKALTQSDS